MEKTHTLVWTLKSKKDLKTIYESCCAYLPEQKAYEVLWRILLRAADLEKFPYIGQKEENLAHLQREYRRLVEGKYKIIYHVGKDKVYVNTIFDTRQSPKKMKVK